MKEKNNIPTVFFLLNLVDEVQSEKSRLVMECLEKHLPDYFEEHFSDKMLAKEKLRETLISTEKALTLYDLSTMIRHLDFSKEEREKKLETVKEQLFKLS